MAAYSHILFDHDGVLVDTEHWYFEATRAMLSELGVSLTVADYLLIQAAGGNAWAQAEAMGCTEVQIAAKRAERNVLYQQFLRDKDIGIPGVPEILQALAANCRMAIVTTAKQEDFDLIHFGVNGEITPVDQRGIVEQMDFVLTNKDYARSKPHPEPYLCALQRFGIDAASALVVEDSERGLRAAVAAGIDCAVVAHPFTAAQDFSAATYHLDEFSDLLGIIAPATTN